MDQQKIGTFLKELRHERGLTQEQLAEKLYVSRRTVSRWETGTNLPDIPLLIELSDLYEVELREILNGERNTKMDKNIEETVLKVAELGNDEKAKLTARFNRIFCAGAVSFAVYMAMLFVVPDTLRDTGWFGFLEGMMLGVSFGTIIFGIIITSKNARKIREAKLALLEKLRLSRSAQTE